MEESTPKSTTSKTSRASKNISASKQLFRHEADDDDEQPPENKSKSSPKKEKVNHLALLMTETFTFGFLRWCNQEMVSRGQPSKTTFKDLKEYEYLWPKELNEFIEILVNEPRACKKFRNHCETEDIDLEDYVLSELTELVDYVFHVEKGSSNVYHTFKSYLIDLPKDVSFTMNGVKKMFGKKFEKSKSRKRSSTSTDLKSLNKDIKQSEKHVLAISKQSPDQTQTKKQKQESSEEEEDNEEVETRSFDEEDNETMRNCPTFEGILPEHVEFCKLFFTLSDEQQRKTLDSANVSEGLKKIINHVYDCDKKQDDYDILMTQKGCYPAYRPWREVCNILPLSMPLSDQMSKNIKDYEARHPPAEDDIISSLNELKELSPKDYDFLCEWVNDKLECIKVLRRA